MTRIDSPDFGPETDALLKQLADLPGPPDPDPYEALLLDREDLPDPALAGVRDPRPSVEDLVIELPGRSLEARVYRMPERPRPILLWLHGGGFVGGHLRDIEYAASGIAAAGNITVVSLNYRLAPENPCPAGLLDAYETLGWIHEHLDGDGRIAIGGQSAGAALAAGACLLARDAGTPLPDRQILCYPVLDLHPEEDWHHWYFGTAETPPTDAARAGAAAALPAAALPAAALPAAALPAGALPVAAVPLQADSLAGLPPTLLLAAQRDSLRADAVAYAARLEHDGVPVELVEYAETMHAFLNFPAALSAGRHAVELIAADLQAAFSARRS